MIVINATTATAQSSGLPDSTLIGVMVSFVSAGLVYIFRQWWEKRKLKRALLTEVEQMDGLKECSKQMSRVGEPPERPIVSDDVPAPDSIPTSVYEQSTIKIGLLGGLLGQQELKGAVRFYSQALRYKGIIRKISDGKDVSDTDQEDLYDEISGLEDTRQQIIKDETFRHVPKD